MQPLVLIVEDEPDIVTMLKYNLEYAGFRTAVARDGEEALLAAKESDPNLILLDWMLPLVSGFEICRQLRRSYINRGIPIIMLTAKSEADDRVRGLNAGADDYITKPFSPQELIARVRAVLRRVTPGIDEELLRCGELEMDLAAHRVRRSGSEIQLGPTEFRLLRHFMQHPDRVFSREQLLDMVWGRDVYIEPRTVDVHIRRLRKALNEKIGNSLIRTVRSAGYALEDRAA
jgi:two-component system phosphate regulon response regulator PhoB